VCLTSAGQPWRTRPTSVIDLASVRCIGGPPRHELRFVACQPMDPPDSDGERLLVATTQPSSPSVSAYVPRTRRWALVAVVLGSFAAAAWVAHPLWVAILLGVVMAVSVHRPYQALLARIGERRATWAAAIVTLGSGVLVGVAGTLVLITLSNELMRLVAHIDAHGNAGSLAGLIGERGAAGVRDLGIDTERVYAWMRRELEAAASYMATLAAIVVRTASYAILALIVSLLTMYHVLLEGPGLARRIERIAPLEPRHTRSLILEAREVGRDAFLGTLATSAIQGCLAGIGYAVLGVPQPVTWAVATALASFLPLIGTLVVWIPISIFLVLDGHPVRAIMLVSWGVLVVTSLADYVIRPRIVGARGHSHPLLTLIALLGGLEVFGLAGLIIAPIVMSVFVAAFRIYEREVRASSLAPSPASPASPASPPASRAEPGSARSAS
jgi:predicted PurR-regulated permease PerM